MSRTPVSNTVTPTVENVILSMKSVKKVVVSDRELRLCRQTVYMVFKQA